MTARSRSKPAADAASELSTRGRLLRAAEECFAEHGVGGTSTRAILKAADQRNESALQYHFGGREGLIEALYLERGSQIAAERERMLAELSQQEGEASVRQLCEIALLPPVRLARQHPQIRLFLKVVGQMAFLPSDKLKKAHERYELDSASTLRKRLRLQLGLPLEVIERRLEIVHRLAAVSLSQRARADQSFRGAKADLYFSTVLDAMAAILTSPASDETHAALGSKERSSERKR